MTGVLGDRFPAELHFFRNYEPPGFDYHKFYANSKFDPPLRATGKTSKYYLALNNKVTNITCESSILNESCIHLYI